MTAGHPTDVVLAAADAPRRLALREAIDADQGSALVAQAADARTAIDVTLEQSPGVLVLSDDLPGLDLLHACRRIGGEAPGVAILVLMRTTSIERQYRALMAGAAGVLPQGSTSPGALRDAVRTLAAGGAAVTPGLCAELVRRYRLATTVGRRLRPVHGPLSAREWEVLDELASGAPTAQVAARLGIASNTVYSHLRSVFRKLDVNSRSKAIAAAERLRSGGRPVHDA